MQGEGQDRGSKVILEAFWGHLLHTVTLFVIKNLPSFFTRIIFLIALVLSLTVFLTLFIGSSKDLTTLYPYGPGR